MFTEITNLLLVQNRDDIPLWLKIPATIIAALVGVATVIGTLLTARKTRIETRKLERELATPDTEQSSDIHDPIVRTSPMAVRIQGYIIRFIILYLAYTFWALFTNFLALLVGATSAVSLFGGTFSPVLQATTILPSFFNFAVNLAIFLSIGWPLLTDILRDIGLPPRIFWFRDVRAVFRSGRGFRSK